MNYTQNERINQINEKTLIVGVDIAKKTHYARVFDFRGIELGKIFSFDSNDTGFSNFLNWTTGMAAKHGKTKIIIGIEPTGHYWYTFANAVENARLLLVQVNPYHVKRAKELDDGTPAKNDKKDPKTIALLVKDGRYQIPYMPKGQYAELRKAFDIRERLVKRKCMIKNRIQRWLDIYFPEFLQVFKNWEGKTALITLEKFPLPEMIKNLGAEVLLVEWKKDVKRAVGIKRAKILVETARSTIGLTNGTEMAVYDLQDDLEEYKRYCDKIVKLESKIEVICKEIPGIKNIMSIKGVGLITAAGFIAETGDLRRFNSARQIIKLAGLNIVADSSGKHTGQGRISKRGRSRLRALLFRAIMPIVATNYAFNRLHKYNITLKEKPLKRMESITALCGKLIKIIYKLVINDEMFDPEKMLKDINRGESKKRAA